MSKRKAPPKFSICIPTWQRDTILTECLQRLPDCDCEVIVSDNASTDQTADILCVAQKHDKRIKAFYMPRNMGVTANFRHAVSRATTPLIVWLADDDTLIQDALLEHVARMVAEPGMTALYGERIAWDDQAQTEQGRYLNLKEPAGFEHKPLELVNFILHSMIPPEVGVFRRDALINAHVPFSHALPFNTWLYHYAKQGKVRFDPLPFYREHIVLKEGLERGMPNNRLLALDYQGEGQRLDLETFILLSLQEVGALPLSPENRNGLHLMIDRMLHNRTTLEIHRAALDHDFISAIEMRRRQCLWNGPGDNEQMDNALIFGAAQQAMAQYDGLADPPSFEWLLDAYKLPKPQTIGIGAFEPTI